MEGVLFERPRLNTPAETKKRCFGKIAGMHQILARSMRDCGDQAGRRWGETTGKGAKQESEGGEPWDFDWVYISE